MSQFTNDELKIHKAKIMSRLTNLQSLGLMAQDATSAVPLDQSKVGRLSRMDALQGQAMAKAVAQRRQSELVQLQKALLRIQDGSFGECQECLNDIDPRRVEHNLAVTLCLSCATAQENG